jgi:hypothetical protein
LVVVVVVWIRRVAEPSWSGRVWGKAGGEVRGWVSLTGRARWAVMGWLGLRGQRLDVCVSPSVSLSLSLCR